MYIHDDAPNQHHTREHKHDKLQLSTPQSRGTISFQHNAKLSISRRYLE